MNSVNKIDVINRMYYFFHDMVNGKSLDPNKMKTDEKLYKSILLCHIGYMIVKDLSYETINSVNPLHFLSNKINE